MCGVRVGKNMTLPHQLSLLTDDHSVDLYVRVWIGDDLPGSRPKLGWIDDHSFLFGRLRDRHVSRM
jgi:hypothetical protein